MKLENLNERIRNCRKCRLWSHAKNVVPGEGPFSAKIMLVGQNPGREEDKTGRPFVGKAGKYLNRILIRNNFNRADFFVTNVVKHASPKNRKPLNDEVEACTPYLLEQIRIIKPKIVVLMGAIAWRVPRFKGIEYFKTYHPSAAMRFKKIGAKFEADFSILKRILT